MNSKPLKLYHLISSPNSIKIRLALNYKKLPFEKIPVDPMDRSTLTKVSGQPLTPVLLHGETVVYDSYAIIRYLDANFPNTPHLFRSEYAEMKKIEEWELFARTEASRAVGMMLREWFASGAVKEETVQKANAGLKESARRVEEVLSGQSFLLDNKTVTAADLTVAPMFWYGLLEEKETQTEVLKMLKRHLELTGFPKITAWVRKIMEWDTP